MVCTTFLRSDEGLDDTSSDEVNYILKCVRDSTGEDWRVIERQYKVFSLFNKNKIVKNFSLYKGLLDKGIDFQVLTVCSNEREVLAYLYGYISGVNLYKKNKKAEK